jgi:hypothetical protein
LQQPLLQSCQPLLQSCQPLLHRLQPQPQQQRLLMMQYQAR